MMICAADFEELFPDLFQPATASDAQPKAKAPSTECIARWEDDGGLHIQAARRPAVLRSAAPPPTTASRE